MKKVNFFKVMSACVAFAAVTFTSCSEEDMTLQGPGNITIPEMPESPVIPATASVSVSVYSVSTSDATSNGILLAVSSIDATENIGKTMTVECPAIEGYIVAPATTVAIPQLNEGQAVVVPVAFYVASEGTAEAEILKQLKDGEVVAENILLDETETFKNEEATILVKKEINYKTWNICEGWKYLGKYEAPESKAAATGFEFVEKVLKAMNSLEDNETKWNTFEWNAGEETGWEWLNPYHQAQTTIKQGSENVVYTVSFNGETYEVEFEVAGQAKWTMTAHTVIPEYAHEWAHLHTHGHAGHDYMHGSNNAGGGIVGAE